MAAAEVRPENEGETETEPAGAKPKQFLLPIQGKELAGASGTTPARSSEPPEPSSKTTLRALQMAADSDKARASAKEQASNAAGLLRIAEQQLVEERKLRATETARLTTQLAGLSENLSAAVRHTTILEEAGRRERRRMLGVCAILIAAALAVTALLVHTRRQPQPALPAPVIIKESIREEVTVDPKGWAEAGSAEAGSAEAKALDRFMTALSLLPEGSIPAVLRSANRLLSDSGAQPCSVESPSGQPAVLFGPGSRGQQQGQQQGAGPLARALSRCAEAVERTLHPADKHAENGPHGDTAAVKKE
jgi:hypothetical protein